MACHIGHPSYIQGVRLEGPGHNFRNHVSLICPIYTQRCLMSTIAHYQHSALTSYPDCSHLGHQYTRARRRLTFAPSLSPSIPFRAFSFFGSSTFRCSRTENPARISAHFSLVNGPRVSSSVLAGG